MAMLLSPRVGWQGCSVLRRPYGPAQQSASSIAASTTAPATDTAQAANSDW
ncbi:hypothetical protein [Kitasatospora aureofaciens]|uniref:hypothetical protein n=1 Tax=Kitasatospora aureofaciens TaxID=1894 RepID=UPI0038061613